MERAHFAYAAYIVLFLIINAFFFAVPLLAFTQDMGGVYKLVRDLGICHQKLSRSLCVFNDGKGYWVADCTAQDGSFVGGATDRLEERVVVDGAVGYKMPVCARDFGIYGAMLLAGLAYPFFRKLDGKELSPAIWLILAMVPIGLDGGIQLLSDLHWVPFAYESTNMIRLLTGAIAGGVAAFYAIPLLINLISKE